jgi:hypothetical protein
MKKTLLLLCIGLLAYANGQVTNYTNQPSIVVYTNSNFIIQEPPMLLAVHYLKTDLDGNPTNINDLMVVCYCTNKPTMYQSNNQWVITFNDK